jgi:phage repressor protein C with HTH and peptisase S24 domain
LCFSQTQNKCETLFSIIKIFFEIFFSTMAKAEKITEILSLKGGNVHQLEQKLKLSNGSLRKAISRNSDLKGEIIEGLLSLYPDLNRDWLMFDEGEAFIETNVSHEKNIETNNSSVGEHHESYIQKRRKLKQSNTGPFMVPLVPVKAQAGYVRAYDQAMYVDALEKYALPPGVNPQGAVWRYWEIEGDSMEPAFHNKDIILTSQVHQFDWENLRNFYLYVIVTNEKVLFKRVFAKNDLEWVLISENEDVYQQQLLPVEF